MINGILGFVQQFLDFFIWWTVIQPWEQGIRVRLGKHRTRLMPGIHWKIPYLDLIYRQSTRLRFAAFGPQTVTSADGRAVTLSGVIGYSIVDLDRLYDTMQHAEDAFHAIVSGIVAEYVQTHGLSECNPDRIISECMPKLSFEEYGLHTEKFSITTFAVVRTYRLIQDSLASVWGGSLNTTKADGRDNN